MTGSPTPTKNVPSEHELEISLFGPGLGESVVVHLGNGDWLIVDSCLDPSYGGEIAALGYLDELGVNPNDAVKLVVATHWHDDHIAGLSKILKAAPQAKFAITAAFGSEDFRAAIAPWLPDSRPLEGGLDEIWRLGNSGLLRRSKLASEHKMLFERAGSSPCRVMALSPSDPAVLSCIARLQALPKAEFIGRMPRIEENHTSVVLSVELHGRKILLGGDLQVRADRSYGWLAVVDLHTDHEAAKYELIKISHHGSENGDHPEIWSHLMSDSPIAIMTPFVRGKVKLPKDSDVSRVVENTSCAYLTAPPKGRKFRTGNRMAEKKLLEAARSVQCIPRAFGHIRARLNLKNQENWIVDCFGAAYKLERANA